MCNIMVRRVVHSSTAKKEGRNGNGVDLKSAND